MMNAIIKTFIVAHVDDTDEHLAQALVYNAGRLAWRMRESGLTTEQKSKTNISDVVTAADRAAEKFIADALATIRPEDGVLGEEGTQRPSQSGRTWVIDPVDGTYNFSTGSDYWCSALALVKGSPNDPAEIIFGAVHRPAMGYTWFGGSDIPTSLDGKSVGTIEANAPEKTCLATYLHPTDFHQHDLGHAWAGVVSRFATVRMLGSASVDMAGVATGQHGAWMQRSVAAWDWLPGRALVEGAGGVAITMDAAGSTWSIAGSETAVEAICESLQRGY
ncbi:inositol monophosphatase [Corynebacterium sp. 4HC-13]|uniref:inositol monophosphatase family protein n=1 Tax=Corynebacterium anserum TaxID=2684406 RepID=UPI00163A667E|nr:inositol monophosphatase family protein [Corynebacterium anserum]MBC2681002.1 inositol monophosphatase [Corynebacterium anserum]